MNEKKRVCRACYWAERYATPDLTSDQWICHLNPPTMIPTAQGGISQPALVLGSYWCSFFEPREQING